MTALIEQMTYYGDVGVSKLNSCTKTLDIIGSALMFSARTLFNGRSVSCCETKNSDTGKITLDFDNVKFPKKNFWRVTLAIILFFPLTPLGLLIKGAALICSKNLRDYYFEFHEYCKRPLPPKRPTNVSHIKDWPPPLEPYKDYQDHLYYPLHQNQATHSHSGIDLKHIKWPRVFSSFKTIKIKKRAAVSILLHYNEETARLGHLKAFIHAHVIIIGGDLKGFEGLKNDDTQKIKDILANGDSSVYICL